MFFIKSNLSKSIFLLLLSSMLPINISKANTLNNHVIGKWCATRVVSIMGDNKIPIDQQSKNCFTFKRDGSLIVIGEFRVGKSFYEVLDAENVLITATNGKQTFMRFVKNTGELKAVNSTGDIYSYAEVYYEKQ